MKKYGTSAIAVLLWFVAPAVADDVADCDNATLATTVVRACGALIESNTYKEQRLARLYEKRARGHAANGDYAFAVEDLTRAIAIAPEDPFLFSARGAYLAQLGKRIDALADYDRASALHKQEIDRRRKETKSFPVVAPQSKKK
jgi:tetratricopeptide (TPR) repeat protein